MIKWAISLTMLFKEYAFPDRLHAATEAGFGAVEFMWPAGVDLKAIVAAKQTSGVDVILLNVDEGNVPDGDRGFPNDPARQIWWRDRALVAFDLATRLQTRQINVLAGNEVIGLGREAMLDCLCENLAWALAQAPDITFQLEALNRFENPRYLLGSTADVNEVIKRLGNPRVKFQFDVYHTQRSEGNLAKLLEANISHIGHIQIADSPARNQPGSGEINWQYTLGQLERLDYSGYVGLEYNPLPDTQASLAWLPRDKRISCTAVELNL